MAGAVGAARSEPFKVRGIKGLWWQGIANYRKALPWLAEHKLNFLMLCYTSFSASGTDWRSDYTAEEKEQIRALASEGRRLGVDVCLAFNPGIWSKPPLVYANEQDYQAALDKVKTVHALGVRWFALCLDDISRALEPADAARFGTLEAAQVYFVNRLWHDMKKLRPRPRLIFCPSTYLTADAAQHLDYITTIGRGIDPEVMMFWTGPQCCSASITAEDARAFGKWIRRKPFVWDNYPVNDMYAWRPLLGPLRNRSADLGREVSGYIANPMKQWRISTIPLTTTAAYLNDPDGYDPDRAIETAIKSFPADQQRAVRLLVELYGSSFWGEPGFPPQPQKLGRDEAARVLPRYRALCRELARCEGLADVWEEVKATVEGDIAWLERRSMDRRTQSPLSARGDDFEGGAGSVFGYRRYDRAVNYVYARPTGYDTMSAVFYLDDVPVGGAALRLVGRNGDTGKPARVRITLNDMALVDGDAVFGWADFETRTFEIPASALKPGADTLVIANLEGEGVPGMPPWFMVAEAEIIPKGAADRH